MDLYKELLDKGEVELCYAIRDIDDLEIIKQQYILKKSEEELNGICNHRYDYYLLHQIIYEGNEEIVSELCKFVIPLLKKETLFKTISDYEGGHFFEKTALHAAIEEGYLEVAEMLISYMFTDLNDINIKIQKLKYENLIELNKTD